MSLKPAERTISNRFETASRSFVQLTTIANRIIAYQTTLNTGSLVNDFIPALRQHLDLVPPTSVVPTQLVSAISEYAISMRGGTEQAWIDDYDAAVTAHRSLIQACIDRVPDKFLTVTAGTGAYTYAQVSDVPGLVASANALLTAIEG